MNSISLIVKELIRASADRKEMRKFGLIMASVILIFGLIALWRGKPIANPLLIISGTLVVLALLLPVVLRLIYVPWMLLAHMLGWVMTRVILTLTFYLVMTPIGLLMRMFAKDPLARRFPGGKDTYWIPWEEPEGGRKRHYKPY